MAWPSLALRMAAFAAALLLPAGTWRWWEAWAVILLWLAYATSAVALLSRSDPELLAERLKASPAQAGQKTWDKLLMALMIPAGFALFIVPGLDVVRFRWSEPLPLWMELAALLAHLPAFALLARVMRENTYLSRVVKIAHERDHHVITTGPYRVVRHPMYVAVIAMLFAVPLALGSRYALIPAALLTALLVARTVLEDRSLHEELPGYAEYARKTRYRLIPRVW